MLAVTLVGLGGALATGNRRSRDSDHQQVSAHG